VARNLEITFALDRTTAEFLEHVYLLLVTVEEADAVLITDEVARAAERLRGFLDDHGKRLFA
jgi:hypothetical protein